MARKRKIHGAAFKRRPGDGAAQPLCRRHNAADKGYRPDSCKIIL
jgi:hypothetical protein